VVAATFEIASVGGAVTDTVVAAFTDPTELVAVSVYVVVAVGDTVSVPVAATLPIPLSIVIVVAFDVFHDSVEKLPLVMDEGDADSVAVGGTGPSGGIGHSSPLISGLVVGVQLDGGRGNTAVFGW
jgi:hypothetical protein